MNMKHFTFLSTFFSLFLSLLVSPQLNASEYSYGIAAYRDVYGLQIEKSWDTKSFYGVIGVKAGQTGLNRDHPTVRFGYRTYLNEPTWKTGWFVGPTLSDYSSIPKAYRPGLGLEIGKQWLSTNVRITASGSVGMASEYFGGDEDTPNVVGIEPIFNLGLAAMIRTNRNKNIEYKPLEEKYEEPHVAPQGKKSWWKFWQGLDDF